MRLKEKMGAIDKRICIAEFTVKTLLYLPHVVEILIIIIGEASELGWFGCAWRNKTR